MTTANRSARCIAHHGPGRTIQSILFGGALLISAYVSVGTTPSQAASSHNKSTKCDSLQSFVVSHPKSIAFAQEHTSLLKAISKDRRAFAAATTTPSDVAKLIKAIGQKDYQLILADRIQVDTLLVPYLSQLTSALVNDHCSFARGHSPGSTQVPVHYVNTWTFTATAGSGYTESGEFQVGAPEHIQTGMTNGTATLGNACSVNAQTDAVEPARLVITNTTAGFSSTIGLYLHLSLTLGADAPNAFDWEGEYADGPQCDPNLDSGMSLDASATAAPSQSLTIDGFLILNNYYSPSDPSGDPSDFNITALVTTDQSGVQNDGSDYTIDSVDGPGTITETAEQGFPGWLFTLNGTAPPVND
jgi:hypothetical protein